MGLEDAAEAASLSPHLPPPRPKKLTLLPLIALIFYDVSGGPFGIEDSISSGGGPLLPLLGFLLLPVIWSLPESLLTAELSSAFPSNGGFLCWASAAFPSSPLPSFLLGFSRWVSGTLDNALYPILFLDYLKGSVPLVERFEVRICLILAITAALTFLNWRGLHVVGVSAVALTVFSLSPFLVMGLLGLPKIRPIRWVQVDFKKVNWRGFFNCMFWNLNYWDKASTLAGEVEDASRNFPRAIFGAIGLVVGSYLVPLLVGTGAMEGNRIGEWTDGFFAEVGMVIGGSWLRWWIQAAAAMSNLGLFEAEMSSDSFQLLGMSEMGMIPEIFSRRSNYGTPTISILCSATGVLVLSWMSFQEILEFLNFLYALGMLLEFAAFIKLRLKKPDLDRPYRVPVGTIGAILISLPPTLLLVLVMCLASRRTFIVSGIVLTVGVVLYFAIQYMKVKKWVKFISSPISSESHFGGLSTLQEEVVDEASISLLPDHSSTKKEPHNSETILEGVSKLEYQNLI